MLIHRNPPQISPPEVKSKPGVVHQVRAYRLITPLFGGGAEPQKPDEVTVVRASEIRGLLRFWWRATRGGQFGGDLTAMRAAEEAIWGSAAGRGKPGPSPVSLVTKVTQPGQSWREVPFRRNRINIGDPRSPYGYVAFPLRDSRGSVWRGIEFELHLALYKTVVHIDGHEVNLRQEIEAALWAWETFGGVGARTRRGFGALELVALEENGQAQPVDKPLASQMRQWIISKLEEYVRGNRWPEGVPHLHPTMPLAITPRSQDADDVWKKLFSRLKEFRQARYPDARGRPYGRSKWPEPDSIRRLTGQHSPGHAPKHPVNGKYPRGRLGLPIIFQFKPEDERAGDPPKTVLEGAQAERFASRLILRPVACRDGVVGLACVLQGPSDPPGGYVLKKQANGQVLTHLSPAKVALTPEETSLIEPLHGEPDVLKAFLKTLGWKE